MSKWMRVAALMLLPVLTACTEDSDPIDNDDPAEDITMIRLTIGEQTVDITEQGANRNVDIVRGTTPVSATFLNAGGTTVTLPSNSTYALDLESQNTNRLSFTRTGAFSGTFTGMQTGTVLVAVSLLHGSHEHLGPRNVTFNVLPATDTIF